MSARLALIVAVPNYAAARALPALVELLRNDNHNASFHFALGPDWLGRSLARHAVASLRRLRDAAFDLGIYAWQSRVWQRRAANADARWSQTQLERALQGFHEVFELPARSCAAPGWISNRHALRLTQRLGFQWACDTRGQCPFLPVWDGELIRCPQIPVTLPTLSELAATTDGQGRDGIDRLLALTEQRVASAHVFHLGVTAALARDLSPLRRLFSGWRQQGYRLCSLADLAAGLDLDSLPRHEIVIGTVAGHPSPVLRQGDDFLSTWSYPHDL